MRFALEVSIAVGSVNERSLRKAKVQRLEGLQGAR